MRRRSSDPTGLVKIFEKPMKRKIMMDCDSEFIKRIDRARALLAEKSGVKLTKHEFMKFAIDQLCDEMFRVGGKRKAG